MVAGERDYLEGMSSSSRRETKGDNGWDLKGSG